MPPSKRFPLAKMDSEADLFAALRNDFNFAYVSEFLNHFSSAFFNERDDDSPTSPVKPHSMFLKAHSFLVLGTLAFIPIRS